MIKFNLYVGKVLYKTTYNSNDAFSTFRKWQSNGLNVRMQLFNVRQKVA